MRVKVKMGSSNQLAYSILGLLITLRDTHFLTTEITSYIDDLRLVCS